MAAAAIYSIEELLQLTNTKDQKEAQRLVEEKKRKARAEEERKRQEEERKRTERKEAHAAMVAKAKKEQDGRFSSNNKTDQRRNNEEEKRKNKTSGTNYSSSRKSEPSKKKPAMANNWSTLGKIANNFDPNEFRLSPLVKSSKDKVPLKVKDSAGQKQSASPSNGSTIFMNKKATLSPIKNSKLSLSTRHVISSVGNSARQRTTASAKAAPLQRAQTQKRDQRSIPEIQEDIQKRTENKKSLGAVNSNKIVRDDDREKEAVKRRREEILKEKQRERDIEFRKSISNGTSKSTRGERYDHGSSVPAKRRPSDSPPRKRQRSISPQPRKRENPSSLSRKGNEKKFSTSEPYHPGGATTAINERKSKRAPSPYRPDGVKSRRSTQNNNSKRRPPSPYRPSNAGPPRSYDNEYDSDLESFIVDDDEEDPDNSVQGVLKQLYGYDRKRFRNDQFSDDDDMEADTSEVFREEARSARIAKKEDAEEERLEREAEEKRRRKMVERERERGRGKG